MRLFKARHNNKKLSAIIEAETLLAGRTESHSGDHPLFVSLSLPKPFAASCFEPFRS